MRRREDHDITKHTLNLYAGDYAKLQSLYPTRIGAAKVIRDIVRAHIRLIEESAGQKTPLIHHEDFGLDLGDSL